MAAANPRMATLPEAAQRAMVVAEQRSREIKQKLEAQWIQQQAAQKKQVRFGRRRCACTRACT